ncbi:ankyrin repeat domain-containing protein [Psychroflexus sp. MES1-P1E]|uniref:ankyrin repeat domain-containing protein n=1 Tax=Psychroflexus sp. MES1-P1E TaxID=2058320 RepID=UPI000C7DB009|nr:ankyrin repeat domain-containing protein [Psychroflexus sp. MES1-P1E]PKG41461.1 hypothetical protein CXF67_15510 [Psychroflexus sp. MES1-P1E]
MKNKIIILLVFSSFISLTNAQEATLNSLEFTSIQKLEIFAKGCNSSQIKQLLENDTIFEINYGGITLTPIQLAINTFITANNNDSIWKCDECISSISSIMKDQRYDFKVQPNREKTDLIYAISRDKDVKKDPLAQQRFGFVMYSMLDRLDEKIYFDIDYSISTNVNSLPETALQSASAYGNLSLCILINRYPTLLRTIDQRNGSDKFTPLMFASRFNNIYSAEKLLFYGADYLENFNGYPINGIAVIGISKMSGYTEMTKLLQDYKDGKINLDGCK